MTDLKGKTHITKIRNFNILLSVMGKMTTQKF